MSTGGVGSSKMCVSGVESTGAPSRVGTAIAYVVGWLVFEWRGRVFFFAGFGGARDDAGTDGQPKSRNAHHLIMCHS